jgi:hypothetical protein
MVELCKTDNKCKITYWKERTKTALNGRTPLRWRRSAMDSSAFEEEEKENT